MGKSELNCREGPVLSLEHQERKTSIWKFPTGKSVSFSEEPSLAASFSVFERSTAEGGLAIGATLGHRFLLHIGLDQGGRHGGGDKCWGSEYILKGWLSGFGDGWM